MQCRRPSYLSWSNLKSLPQVPASKRYAAPVKHDDVVIVPEFFCKEDDWDTYYALIKAGLLKHDIFLHHKRASKCFAAGDAPESSQW